MRLLKVFLAVIAETSAVTHPLIAHGIIADAIQFFVFSGLCISQKQPT
jgi:hypothetical protein